MSLAASWSRRRRPSAGPRGHRDGDGVVEHDDRRGLHGEEARVERDDLRPVGVVGARGARVQRRDRRLQREGVGGAAAQRLLDEREALADLRLVPARAILLLEQHEIAVGA